MSGEQEEKLNYMAKNYEEAVEMLPNTSVCVTDEVTIEDEEDYSDPVHKRPNHKQKHAALVCRLLVIGCCVGLWAGVIVYALSSGNPAQLVNPSNSEGEICGQGNQSGKPYLLYFDLSQCAGISAVVGGCPTTQVCVEECPNSYWTFSQGKSSDLQQFCDKLTPGQLEDSTTSISQLVEERSCPAYLLPSQPVLGRCVPTYSAQFGEEGEAGRSEAKMSAIKTEGGEVLDVNSLMGGVKYVMESIDTRGYGEKFLACIFVYQWMILLSFLLTLFLSLTWTVLIELSAKPVLWTSIVLCLTILVAGTVFSLTRYSQLGTEREDIITSMSSYSYNKNTWLVCGIIICVIPLVIFILLVFTFKRIKVAIKLIDEAPEAVSSLRSVLLFLILQSLVKVLVIAFCGTIASFLSASGSPEYRVVNACPFETFTNPATDKMFALNDICDPSTFSECTGCPTAQCVHHKYGPPSVLGYWLQVWNLAGMFWLLLFVQSLGRMLVAAVFDKWFWTEGGAAELSYVDVWTCFKETCKNYLGKQSVGSFVCGAKSGYVLPAMYGDSCNAVEKRNHKRCRNLHKMTNFALFTVKLLIVATVASSTVIAQVSISLDTIIIYHFGPILLVVLHFFPFSSGFFVVEKNCGGKKNANSMSLKLNRKLELSKLFILRDDSVPKSTMQVNLIMPTPEIQSELGIDHRMEDRMDSKACDDKQNDYHIEVELDEGENYANNSDEFNDDNKDDRPQKKKKGLKRHLKNHI